MDRATSPAEGDRAAVPDVVPDARARAKPSFAEIYRDGFSFAWRNLRRLGVAEESVRDAAQDVFLVVHRRLDSYDGTSTVRTWLFAISLRVARDYRRAERRKAVHVAPTLRAGELDAVEGAPSREAGPLERAEAAEANRLLLRLLDELDEERRAVFVMTELEQMTAPEIAEALELNLNTVYGRLRAARHQFNEALARYRARPSAPTWRLP
jgi:RNA polymerase sigma-70 factor (ECF subfamily)